MLGQFLVGLESVAMGITKKKFIMNYAKFLKSGLKSIEKIIDHYLQIFLQKNFQVNFNCELIVPCTKHLPLGQCKQMKV